VLTFEDMEHIAKAQVAREQQQALLAHRWLICDTTPLTTLLYSELMFGRVADGLGALARRPYAVTFLCAADFPFVQDGTRRDECFRELQQVRYQKALLDRGMEFHALTGSIEQRVKTAVERIRSDRA